MSLSPVTHAHAAQRLAQLVGGPLDSIEALSDLVRAEVHARRHAPRAMTLNRTARLLAPVVLDGARLEAACDALEREGDVVMGPGGILYSTPTRVVALKNNARVFSSVPTRALAVSLGREVAAQGATRQVASVDGLAEAVMQLGGAVVTPEDWAGLSYTPHADAAFLRQLEQRLEWASLGAGSLEKHGVLDWRAWQVTDEGARWRRGAEGRLWSARAHFGGHQHAWTANGSPSTSPFIVLSPDEADRARFALSREIEGTSVLRIERSATSVTLEVPGWLPRPEYRWLSLHAVPTRDTNGLRWEVAADDETMITALLVERLGLSPRSETSVMPVVDAARLAPPRLVDTADACTLVIIDDRLPTLPLITPLLKKLRVETYRELLALDLGEVARLPAVGSGKIKQLEELRTNVRSRIAIGELGSPTAVVALPSKYDNWDPRLALGPLNKRILTVIASNGLDTISSLKAWHRRTDPTQVPNYGNKSHSLLGDTLTRLEADGHEALIFGGPSPANVKSLAGCFLEQIERIDRFNRDLFELRFIDQFTLEQIGERKELTRERVRQIIENTFELMRPSWGPHARQLLEPASLILDTQGGIATSKAILESLGDPPQWAIEISCELAKYNLSVDIIPTITTVLSAEEFRGLQKELRETLGAHMEQVTPGVLHETFAFTGLHILREDLPTFADAILGFTIDGGVAFPNRRSLQTVYLQALRDAGGPVSAEEVARRVNEIDPTFEATKRKAVAHFQRAPGVLSHSHNKWIHEDLLPISREALDALAAQCLSDVKKAAGRAVSVRLLLDSMKTEGTASSAVTPNMLRDALIDTGRVRGWRSGTDVAWVEEDVTKTTIAEWLQEVAPELEQPFDMSELIHTVARRTGYLVSSLVSQASIPLDNLIAVGRGQYVCKEHVWHDNVLHLEAVRRAETFVLSRELWSAEDPALRIAGLEAELARFGPGIVWGLVRNHMSDAVVTKGRGLFMWSKRLGDNLWSALSSLYLDAEPLFRPRDLRDFLSARGLASEHVVDGLVQEGTYNGHLCRVGLGWYMDARKGLEQQIELLAAKPEIRHLVLGSQDFVRESQLRDILNEVRARFGAFRVPAG